MGFVYPYFLFGLFAIAIPIVIHLFNFRRFKKVYFTNVRLLKDLEIESRKQNKVKNRLLLLLRCLSIIFLVLLFAGPYIKNEDKALVKQGNNAVLVFIDNSFSMENAASKGNLLDVAKNKAREIAMQYSQSDVFCLMTQDMSGRHKHFVNREQFLTLLSEVETSSASLPMSRILNSAHRFITTSTAKNKTCFYISDFQSSLFDTESFDKQGENDIFVPLKAENVNNIFIDSLWFENSVLQVGQTAQLHLRLINHSADEAEKLSLKLFIDNKQQTASSIDMQANESKVLTMNFTIPHAGILHSKVTIDDNPVCFDDDFYFTLLIRDKIKVLAINQQGTNKHLSRLLQNDSEIEFDNMSVDNIDFGQFGYQSLIILNGIEEISSGLASELTAFLDKGGSLCVIPSKDINIQSYRNFLQPLSSPTYGTLVENKAKVSSIDIDNKLFKGVFTSVTDNMEKPQANRFFVMDKPSGTVAQSIMQFADGNDYLLVSPQKSSDIYLFAVALEEDWSDFVNQSVFVPTLWNICTLSRKIPQPYYTLGDNSFIDLSAYIRLDNEEVCEVKNKDKSISFIPQMLKQNKQIGILSQGQTKTADNYDLFLKDSTIGGFSLNYSRKESRLDFLSENELKERLKDNNISNSQIFATRQTIKTQFQKSKAGFSFNTILIILILITISLEIILLYENKKSLK